MPRISRRAFTAGAAATLLIPAALLAKTGPVDNILMTGLDNSGSMYDANRIIPTLQSLAEVLASRDLLTNLTAGPYGRTVFGLYTWGAQPAFLLPPVVLSRPEPLTGMKPLLLAIEGRIEAIQAQGQNIWADSGTDTPQGMAFGLDQFIYSDRLARRVLNLVTDDDATNRIGSAADFAKQRARAAACDATINALIIGDPNVGAHYFQHEVKFGLGSFVLSAESYPNMRHAWAAKFAGDVA